MCRLDAAAVRRFAAQGWNVAATLRKPAEGGSIKGRAASRSLRWTLTDQASVDAAVRQALARFGANRGASNATISPSSCCC